MCVCVCLYIYTYSYISKQTVVINDPRYTK